MTNFLIHHNENKNDDSHYKPAGMQRFNNVLSTSVQSHW